MNENLKTAQTAIRNALAILSDKLTERMPGERITDERDLCAIANELAHASAQFAWLADMAGLRGGYGRGDIGEKAAIHHAGKKLKKVRKALGFCLP